MKAAVVLGGLLACGTAHAQASVDALDKLRVCSTLAQNERVDCLNRLATDIGPQPAVTPPQAPSNAPQAATEPPLVMEWIVSETTSPLDYSPVAIARPTSKSNDRLALQLSIQCRAGRSELVIATGSPSARRPEEYQLTYSANGAAPVALPLTAATTGPGLAVRADPSRVLSSLPQAGDVTFRLVEANAPPVETRYALDRLKAVTLRLAAPCRWPPTAQGRP
jgi:hypothetical protein